MSCAAAELGAELEASKAVAERLRVEHERLVAAEQAAEARELTSDSRARTAAGRSHALGARAEALQAALDETRARAGVERLAGLPGVLGTLADVVDIDEGCERGFEAAVEDALGTVVVEGRGAARDALRRLHDAGLHGGVLPTGGSQPALSAPLLPPAQLEGRAELLRDRVGSQAQGVSDVLDQLLAGVLLCRGGLAEALRLAEELPSNTIVTLEGDRLSMRGWRIETARSGATRATLETVQRDAESAATSALAAMNQAETDRETLAVAHRGDHRGHQALRQCGSCRGRRPRLLKGS